MIACPLCGYEFDTRSENCHTSCVFNKGCSMIMCPACGYEFLAESRTINLIKALLTRRKEKHKHETVSD
ncbi:MAG: hypothetical protein JSW54_01390 [Fidelibacterota bacterium]|nr:MAG: hypothetical protein JSW54_01390 [Candidatus Neomarinimicrobiota bacterium]